MGKKAIIILMLIVSLFLVNGCRQIIKKGWNPHGWDFQIEGIDERHSVGNNFLIRDDMFELRIINHSKNFSFENIRMSLISKYHFERGNSYEIELIINNENVEGGKYYFAENEEKIKVISQGYFTGTDAIYLHPYFEYQHSIISWKVEFIPSSNQI